jgi:hypothetical protein
MNRISRFHVMCLDCRMTWRYPARGVAHRWKRHHRIVITTWSSAR